MRKTILIALMTMISFMASSQTKILLKVGGNTMTATFTDNEATRELTRLLEQGDITIRMSDYGGFEKVGSLRTEYQSFRHNFLRRNPPYALPRP